MKIKISYFYHIRNMKPNMLPISTAMWDPQWYHNFTYDKDCQFMDKNNVWNGIRAEILNPSQIQPKDGGCRKNCNLDYTSCDFLKEYKKYLESLDFNEIISKIINITEEYQDTFEIKDEIIAVLLVYETPRNHCSERGPLKKWFKENGYQLEELFP